MFILVLSLLLADKPAEIDKAELKKFLGSWTISGHEHGGKKRDAKELASLVVAVDGDKMTTKDGTDTIEESAVVALDAKAKPAAIDVKITAGDDKGKVVKGIYKLDKDKLTICYGEPGKDRPKEFIAAATTGHTLLTLTKKK